jgi:hypothetical protein
VGITPRTRARRARVLTDPLPRQRLWFDGLRLRSLTAAGFTSRTRDSIKSASIWPASSNRAVAALGRADPTAHLV